MARTKNKSNLSLAIAFIGVVFFIIFVSFLFKAFLVIKESKFDGSNKFSIKVIDKSGISVISFSPKDKSISILEFENKKINLNLEKDLQLPIDGEIDLGNNTFNYSRISSSVLRELFRVNYKRKNISYFDLIRLSFFARTISSNSVYRRQILNSYSESQKNTILSLTFSDPNIFTENKTIEIINGTDVSGLGARLGKLITNMGGNVVLVNSRNNIDKSKIYYFNELGYTEKKISKYLNFPLEKSEKRGIADVIIEIGNDTLKDIKF